MTTAKERSREELRDLARRGTRSMVSSGIGVVATFGLTIVVARLASPEVGGVFFAATSVHAIATSICRLGGGTGLVYFVARSLSLGRPDMVDRSAHVARVPVVALGAVVAVIGVVGAPELAPLLLGVDSSSAAGAIRIVGIVVGLGAVGDLATNMAAGLGTVRPLLVLEHIGRPVLQVTAVTAVLVAGAEDLATVVAAYAVPTAFLGLVAMAWAGRVARRVVTEAETGPGTDGEREPPMTYRRFWTFTAPRALQMVVQVTLQKLDIILVAGMLDGAQALLYAATTRFLVVGSVGSHALAVVVQPRISALIARRRLDDVRSLYQASTCWLILLTWPVYLLLGIHGATVLRIFGDDFTEAASVLAILAVAMLFSMACGTVEVVLAMAGQTKWTLLSAVLGLALNVPLNIILIPRWGIDGAAFAWAAAIVARNALSMWRLQRDEGVHPYGRSTLLAIAVATTVFGIPAAIAAGEPIPVLVGAAVASAVVYAGALWWLRRALDLDAFGRASRPPSSHDAPATIDYGE